MICVWFVYGFGSWFASLEDMVSYIHGSFGHNLTYKLSV